MLTLGNQASRYRDPVSVYRVADDAGFPRTRAARVYRLYFPSGGDLDILPPVLAELLYEKLQRDDLPR